MARRKQAKVLPGTSSGAGNSDLDVSLVVNDYIGGYTMKHVLNKAMTQQAFADVVGISQPVVSDLQTRGVILSGQTGAVWLHSYCKHLREVAAGRAASGDLDLATERAGLAKEQKDRIAMMNAQTRKELAPMITMTLALSKVGQQIAAILDALPGVCRRRLNLSVEQIEVIQVEITKARNVAAGIRLVIDDDGEVDIEDGETTGENGEVAQ